MRIALQTVKQSLCAMALGNPNEANDDQNGEWAVEGETDMDVAWVQEQLAAAGFDDDDDWVDPSGGVIGQLFEGMELTLQTLYDLSYC